MFSILVRQLIANSKVEEGDHGAARSGADEGHGRLENTSLTTWVVSLVFHPHRRPRAIKTYFRFERPARRKLMSKVEEGDHGARSEEGGPSKSKSSRPLINRSYGGTSWDPIDPIRGQKGIGSILQLLNFTLIEVFF